MLSFSYARAVRRRLWEALGLFALVLAAAACSAPDPEVALAMSEFAFEPRQINMERGKKSIFVLQNKGTVEHVFAIPKQQSIVQRPVAPGQTAKFEVALPPGNFEFICAVPGHQEAGMAGQITAARPR